MMNEGTIDSLRVREKAVMPELDVLRCGEDPSHMEYQPCCGDCCWFYGEDTYGYGFCPFRFAETHECGQKCEVPLKYVSKKEMRHHMAVLLMEKRWQVRTGDFDSGKISIPPPKEDVIRAIGFAYMYMKVFSKL